MILEKLKENGKNELSSLGIEVRKVLLRFMSFVNSDMLSDINKNNKTHCMTGGYI